MWARGLAHPVTFMGTRDNPGELGGRTPGVRDEQTPMKTADFVKFGAVEVNPRNYYRLMQSGQNTLLFPGGAREALSGRKDYPLIWPDKIDFVRTAAKFNATILPLSAIGMVDSFNVLLEPGQISNLPFVGEQFKRLQGNLSAARYDEKPEDEAVGFPIALPKLPARNYFIFGTPISLGGIDSNDKEACARTYRQAHDEVRRGLDDLMRARKNDPFAETPRRLAYEKIFERTAPTFSVDLLN
jgi:hypothetical protein